MVAEAVPQLTQETAQRAAALQALRNAERDTAAFCELYRPKVIIPGQGLVRYVPYGKQVKYLNALDAGGSVLAFKSRQTGVTTSTMMFMLRACLRPGTQQIVISKSMDDAKGLVRIARLAAATCDPPFPLEFANDNTTELRFTNGSAIQGLAPTKEGGRSYAAAFLLLDEVRALPYIEDTWQAAAPTTTHGGRIAMVSTPDIEGSFYHRHHEEVKHGRRGWSYHVLHWRDWPGRDETWAAVTKEQQGLTDQQWEQEFELAWGQIGDAVISKDAVDLAVRLGGQPYKPPGSWIPGYAAIGGDLSGQGRAETVLLVLDTRETPFRVIELRHSNRWSVKQQQAEIEQVADDYKAVPLLDQTGVGWGIIGGCGCAVRGAQMTGGAKVGGTKREPNIPRDILYGHLAYGCEQGMLAVPEKYGELVIAMRSLTWVKTGLNLDHVDALALAYWAATGGPRRRRIGWAAPTETPREGSNEELSTADLTPAGPLGQR